MPKYRMYVFSVRAVMILVWFALFALLAFASHFHLQEERNTLRIFTWSDVFDPQYLKAFEMQTGIKILISYYDSNEELLVKLKATQGKEYDIIVPSDYAVHILRKEGLLKKLDKQRMPFLSRCNPQLLHHYFDPNNDYSVPLEWGIFGLGINQNFFKTQEYLSSWKMIFDPSFTPNNIVMVNDPREAVQMASHYLFGPLEKLNEEQLMQVEKLLVQQKKWVQCYSEARADYILATDNSPLAASASSYIWRSMPRYPHLQFDVPQEGGFITIENVVVPAVCQKEELIYPFLQFIYSPEAMAHHFHTFAFFPATIDSEFLAELDPVICKLITPSEEQFKHMHFFRPLTDEQTLQKMWMRLKAS